MVARAEMGVSWDNWSSVLGSVGIDDEAFVRNFFLQFDDGQDFFDYKIFAVYSALLARPERRKVRYILARWAGLGRHVACLAAWLT